MYKKKEVEPYSSKHVILRAGAMLIFSVSYKFERKRFNKDDYQVRIITFSQYFITIMLFKITYIPVLTNHLSMNYHMHQLLYYIYPHLYPFFF